MHVSKCRPCWGRWHLSSWLSTASAEREPQNVELCIHEYFTHQQLYTLSTLLTAAASQQYSQCFCRSLYCTESTCAYGSKTYSRLTHLIKAPDIGKLNWIEIELNTFIRQEGRNSRPPGADFIFSFNWDALVKFEVGQPICCCLIAFFLLLISYFTLWPWPLILWPWLLTVNTCSASFVACDTLYQIWAKSNNRQRSYCDLNISPYDLEHASRVPLCSGIIFAKLKLSKPIRSWNVTTFWCWYVM